MFEFCSAVKISCSKFVFSLMNTDFGFFGEIVAIQFSYSLESLLFCVFCSIPLTGMAKRSIAEPVAGLQANKGHWVLSSFQSIYYTVLCVERMVSAVLALAKNGGSCVAFFKMVWGICCILCWFAWLKIWAMLSVWSCLALALSHGFLLSLFLLD